jgi:hypothetical protein
LMSTPKRWRETNQSSEIVFSMCWNGSS